jgi:RNA polymerase sigma factor (sigma-70 family)
MTEDELKKLIAAYLKRNREAEGLLYQYLVPILTESTRRYLAPEDYEYDFVITESLEKVFLRLDQPGGFEGNLKNYARKVAKNDCINHLRRRRKLIHIPIDDDTAIPPGTRPRPNPTGRLEREETRRIIQKAINNLGKRCRNLLRALFFENKTARQIVEETELETVQGVHYRKSMCYKKLAKYLQDNDGDWMDCMKP